MKRKQALFTVYIIIFITTLFIQNGFVSADEKEMVPAFVSSLSVLDPVVYENLVVFPVKSDSFTADVPYITLEEALEKGVLEIKEVDGGRVPQVQFISKSDRHIYVMGGEVLTGCKQDRIVGKDILIEPFSTLFVPVYCVEQGRWTYESVHFFSKKNAGTFNLRSIAQSGEGHAQSHIWEEVGKMNEVMEVDTDSGAYQDAYEKEGNQAKITECEDLLASLPDKDNSIVGVMIGVGTKIVSIDVFTSPVLFKKIWPKILKASVLSGILSKDKDLVTKKDAHTLLQRIADMEYTVRKAAGAGNELYSLDDELSVNISVCDKEIVHIAAFPPVEYSDATSIRDINVSSIDMSSSYYSNMIPPQSFYDQIFLQYIDSVIEEEDDEE